MPSALRTVQWLAGYGSLEAIRSDAISANCDCKFLTVLRINSILATTFSNRSFDRNHSEVIMAETLRQWLSDIGPGKPPIFKGTVTTKRSTSEIDFNSSTLEFKIDGIKVGFPPEKSFLPPRRLSILGQEAHDESLSKFFVHVNNFCNLKCSYCYEEDLPYDQIIEKSLPDKRIEEACRFIKMSSSGSESVHVTFFGGEPFLSFPKVVRFYHDIKNTLGDKRLTAAIVTNGTIMREQHLTFLKENKVDVMVSFDGTREYHECQRPSLNGDSNYDLVVSNIQKLVSAKMSKVSIRITYGQKSLDLLRSIREVAKLGVHDMAFRPVMDGTPVNQWNDLNKHASSLHEVVRFYLSQLVKQKPVIINNVHEVLRRILFQIPKTDYCDWGRICSITPDGDIYPCTHFVGMPEFKMGTIRDETINRDLQTDLLKATEIENLPCKECSVKYLCGGGCRGCSHYVHSDIFREDDYCESRREIVFAVLVDLVELWQDGCWQTSSDYIHSLMAEGHKKHSCDRFS